MSKDISEKISENLERVILRIDEMYDLDKKAYNRVYKQFHSLCEKYSLVEGDKNAEHHKWLLSRLKHSTTDDLLDIHTDLNKFLDANKELKIKVKI